MTEKEKEECIRRYKEEQNKYLTELKNNRDPFNGSYSLNMLELKENENEKGEIEFNESGSRVIEENGKDGEEKGIMIIKAERGEEQSRG